MRPRADITHVLVALLGLAQLTFLAPPADAAPQPIGIPVGKVLIPPSKNRASVRSFCMIMDEAPPKKGVGFRRAFSQAGEAMVRLGNSEPTKLTELLGNGTLSIIPHELTFQDLIDNGEVSAESVHLVNRARRTQPVETLVPWLRDQAKAAIRQPDRSEQFLELASYLDMHLRAYERYTQMDIVLGPKAKNVPFVEFLGPTVLQDETTAVEPAEMPFELLEQMPRSSTKQESIQTQIWQTNAALRAARSPQSTQSTNKNSLVKAVIWEGEVSRVLVEDPWETYRLLTVANRKIDRAEPALKGEAALQWIESHENARAQQFQKQAQQERVATLRIREDFSSADFFDDPKLRIDLDGTSIELSWQELYKDMQGPGSLQLREEIQQLPQHMRLLVARDVFAQLDGDEPSIALYKLLRNGSWNKREVFFDDMSEVALNNIRTLPKIKRGGDLALLSQHASFDVEDQGVVLRLESAMKRENIRHVIPGATSDLVTTAEPTAANIVVLIGHKSDTLREYVRALAASGLLKDKLLVFFTCYEPMDPAFNSEVIRRSGAKGFVFFSREIDVSAVEYVMLEANNLLKSDLGTGLSARELLDLSINNALELAREPELQKQLRILQSHMLLQVSQREPVTPGWALPA